MRSRVGLAAAVALVLVSYVFVAMPAGAAPAKQHKVAVDGTPFIEKMKTPAQPSPAKARRLVAAGETIAAKCIAETQTMVLSLASFDPNHPLVQDVVFFRETAADAPGRTRLWVAWDFLATAWGPADQITCEQLTALQQAADGIIDTDVEYFGGYEQRPDGNPNIDILIYNVVDESYFDPNYGSYIAGFFSSSFQSLFNRNIFILDSYDWAGGLGPNAEEPYMIEGTFAHELVHLIMNDHDPSELDWVGEGLAELAVHLNGFGHTSNTTWYLAYHRDSLTMWGSQLEDYGGCYLFQLYLLENFGTKVNGEWSPDWTRAMVDQPLDGIAGVEVQTGTDMTTLFDAWMLANLQDDPTREAAGGLPMGYEEIDTNPYMDPIYGPWSIRRGIKAIYGADANGNLPISRYGGGSVSGSVEFPMGAAAPYAAYYKSYGGQNPLLSVRFRGDGVSGVAPPEGTHLVGSGGGTLLTDRTLLLNAPVGGTLTFKTWYDIEEEWDYGFVEVSTDGGSSWNAIPGTITRHSTNPNLSTAWANALGGATSTDAAITGASNGWVDASFGLPAGSGVLVRFNYYTDEAVNGRGWFIDDVQATGFADGFETGSGNWSLGGWTVSSGLFQNDWIGAYVNPVRLNGKPASTEIAYMDGTVGTDGYERLGAMIDTSTLGKGRVIVAFANRAAFDEAFDANYLLLAKKKG
jgi:hypothetical protein